MLRFTISVKNAKSLDIAFGGLVAKIRDWRALWPQAIDELMAFERAQFMSRGVAGASGLWAGYKHTYGPDKQEGEPASLRTSAELGREFEESKRHTRKQRAEFGARVAFEADRLYNSLVGKTGDTIEVLEPLRMQWGTAVPYALYHQMGTKRGLPARLILDFTPESAANIRRAIQRESINFSRRLGFKVIAAAGGDVSQFSLSEIRQAGVNYMNQGGPLMSAGAPIM
jgi:phage gpG-like protein